MSTFARKAYISGRMRGEPNYYERFHAVAHICRKAGFDAINPVENEPPKSQEQLEKEHAAALRAGETPDWIVRDTNIVLGLSPKLGDVVVALPDWEKSAGAEAEVKLARWAGINVIHLEPEALEAALKEWRAYSQSAEEFVEVSGDVAQHPVPDSDGVGVRTFSSGATRNVDEGKINPEAFLSPLVVVAFSEYMHKHRQQADGSLRAGDNWQKGFTRESIMESFKRHELDLWLLHRGHPPFSPDHRQIFEAGGTEAALREVLCALYFNVGAYLHEVVLGRKREK